MSVVKELKNLKELDLYSVLLKKGIISLSVNLSYEIYDYFQIRMIVNKEFSNNKSLSLNETSEKFACCVMTVRRSIDFMEKE
jgi:hypothetical protein